MTTLIDRQSVEVLAQIFSQERDAFTAKTLLALRAALDAAEADRDAAVAAALTEAADVAWRFYAKGQVTKPSNIKALIPDAGAALDRALAAQRERAFSEGFDVAASLTPHVHEVMQRKDEAWRKSRAIRAQKENPDG